MGEAGGVQGSTTPARGAAGRPTFRQGWRTGFEQGVAAGRAHDQRVLAGRTPPRPERLSARESAAAVEAWGSLRTATGAGGSRPGRWRDETRLGRQDLPAAPSLDPDEGGDPLPDEHRDGAPHGRDAARPGGTKPPAAAKPGAGQGKTTGTSGVARAARAAGQRASAVGQQASAAAAGATQSAVTAGLAAVGVPPLVGKVLGKAAGKVAGSKVVRTAILAAVTAGLLLTVLVLTQVLAIVLGLLGINDNPDDTTAEPVDAQCATGGLTVQAGADGQETAYGLNPGDVFGAPLSTPQYNYQIGNIATALSGVTDPRDKMVVIAVLLAEGQGRNYYNDGVFGHEDLLGTPVTKEQVAEAGLSRAYAGPLDPAGSDHTSVGIFQQQNWWADGVTADERAAQRMSPAYAAGRFVERLVGLGANRYATLTPWGAGQKVQGSAYADGSNYRAQWGRAQTVYSAITGQTPPALNAAGDRFADTSAAAGAGGGAWSVGNPCGGVFTGDVDAATQAMIEYGTARMPHLVPYTFGGSNCEPGGSGCDCSGFVAAAVKAAFGIDLPHGTGYLADVAAQHGVKVSDRTVGAVNWAQMQPGDIFIQATSSGRYQIAGTNVSAYHTGIYLGDTDGDGQPNVLESTRGWGDDWDGITTHNYGPSQQADIYQYVIRPSLLVAQQS